MLPVSDGQIKQTFSLVFHKTLLCCLYQISKQNKLLVQYFTKYCYAACIRWPNETNFQFRLSQNIVMLPVSDGQIKQTFSLVFHKTLLCCLYQISKQNKLLVQYFTKYCYAACIRCPNKTNFQFRLSQNFVMLPISDDQIKQTFSLVFHKTLLCCLHQMAK